MTTSDIFIKGRPYHYHSTYTDINKAKRIALYYKKKTKSRYFILTTEAFFTGRKIHKLYLTRVFSIT